MGNVQNVDEEHRRQNVKRRMDHIISLGPPRTLVQQQVPEANPRSWEWKDCLTSEKIKERLSSLGQHVGGKFSKDNRKWHWCCFFQEFFWGRGWTKKIFAITFGCKAMGMLTAEGLTTRSRWVRKRSITNHIDEFFGEGLLMEKD